MRTRIIGTGSYFPKNVIDNHFLSGIVDTNDEWIRSRTGIKERRISLSEDTAFMAKEAALRACEDSGVAPAELDIIILATTSNNYYFPSGACIVQRDIGAVNATCFDVSAACSGFIYGLHIMDGFIKSGIYKKGLVIGGETLSKLTDWDDRSTCVLFGDGAGAAVVQASDQGILGIDIGSDGRGAEDLYCQARQVGNFKKYITGGNEKAGEDTNFGDNGHIYMDGQEIFKFAVRQVPKSIERALLKAGKKKDEISLYLLHQANERIIQSVSKRLRLPDDKFPVNLSSYGNTSAATIPILMDELHHQGRLKKGDLFVLSGFGAGLTWGSVVMEW